MTWKTDYIKSEAWAGNDYLVQPETAVKQCACCQERKYSSEFVDFDSFVDHKLPACIDCLRKRDGSGREAVRKSGVMATCQTCGDEVLVGDMVMRFSVNQVDDTCLACRREKLSDVF